jgi:sugar phosphate isomerase/epimerase
MMKPKIGLHSITYTGMFYDGPALSIKEVISRAKRFGFQGIELDARAPHAMPYLLSERDRQEIVENLDREGIELSAIAGRNDFSSPVIEHRDANVQLVVALIRLCRDLGAPVLRVLTAMAGSSRLNGRGTYEVARPAYAMAFPQTPEMDRWKYCLACFRTVARVAEDEGVILALQNHPPVVRNHTDCLAMIEEVDSPNFQMSFDVSGERAWQSTEWLLAAAHRIGDRWVHSHYSGDFKRNPDGSVEPVPLGRPLNPKGSLAWNTAAWVQGMFEVGYSGYVNYESCTPTYLPNGELVPIDVIDERVQMARDYMSSLFAKYEDKE